VLFGRLTEKTQRTCANLLYIALDMRYVLLIPPEMKKKELNDLSSLNELLSSGELNFV
jgi:hypothetical protein